ncbi:MAG: Lrp/AsnC family transcriptional regulator [Thalassobaculaceae bacterium]|nr:Lrp/AsnC family transcriptional regulator [Thalassobaculaceae bacterium]
MDAIDLKILKVLQEDARVPLVQLAERVSLSPTPCGRRLNRLEKEGYIDRYVALLNGAALGIAMSVFVFVRLKSQTTAAVQTFERAIKLIPEIMACYLVTGDHDYVLHVRLGDVRDFKDFVRDRLIGIDSIQSTESSVVLEEVKSTTALPLGI